MKIVGTKRCSKSRRSHMINKRDSKSCWTARNLSFQLSCMKVSSCNRTILWNACRVGVQGRPVTKSVLSGQRRKNLTKYLHMPAFRRSSLSTEMRYRQSKSTWAIRHVRQWLRTNKLEQVSSMSTVRRSVLTRWVWIGLSSSEAATTQTAFSTSTSWIVIIISSRPMIHSIWATMAKSLSSRSMKR